MQISTNSQLVHSSSPIIIVSTDQNTPITVSHKQIYVSPTVLQPVDGCTCGSAVIGEFNSNNKLMTQ